MGLLHSLSRFLLLTVLVSSLVPFNHAAPSDLTSCGGKPADILFLLDASGSIWGPHFDDQLKFVRNTVDMFDLSPDKTRIGVFTFGDKVREEIPLEKSLAREELLEEITGIKQLRGQTFTHDALSAALNTLEKHGRKGIPHLVIIMTDGVSEFPEVTKDMAHALHDIGVITLSVGIGHSTNPQELQNLASQPNYVFTVASFTALETIRETLAITACEVEVPTIPPTTSGPIAESCGGKPADIVFVLDASGSIWRGDFQIQLDFVKDVVDIFDISDDATHIGVMTFGNEPEDQFTLDTYQTKQEIQDAVENIKQQKGDTYTNRALRHMLYYHFDKQRSRPGVVKIGIVITDGLSNEPVDTEQEAAEAHKLGVHLFAIGVGKADYKELNAIASGPPESYVFQVDKYSALDKIKEILAIKACEVKDEPPEKDEPKTTPAGPVDKPCVKDAPTDVVIALPARVSGTEMVHIVSWIHDLIEKANEKVRFGIAAKDCPPMPSFSLKDFSSRKTMLNKLSQFRYSPADTAAIIKRMRKFSFQDCPRAGSKKIGVVVVDRPSANLPITTMEAFLAVAQQGIELFVVSVGKAVSEEEKMAIAGEPASEHILDVPDYVSLTDITDTLLERINNACAAN